MAQLTEQGRSRRSTSSPVLGWKWIVAAFTVGILLGGAGGVVWSREFSYPRTHTVVGTVQAVDSEGSSFGFKPDDGTPLSYSVGGAQGAQYLVEGARVTLTFVDVSAVDHLVAEVSPA